MLRVFLEILGDLRGQLEGLGKSVADTTGALGGQVSTAVQSQLEAFRGQISDLEIQANEIMRMRDWLEETLAKHSGRSVEQVRADIDRDKILTAEEAQEYGIIDQVLDSRKINKPSTVTQA